MFFIKSYSCNKFVLIVTGLVSLFFLSFFCAPITAQSFQPTVLGSAGTFATSASGSMAWTIGEVMTETYSSANNFFTQGFHQPDTAYVTMVSNPVVAQGISVYPNPVVDNLVIDFSLASGNYRVEIIDMTGQIIRIELIPADKKQFAISFHEFAGGIYLLQIVNTETQTKVSYKINNVK